MNAAAWVACLAAGAGLSSLADADVALLTQERAIGASYDAGNLSQSAPDFGPFVASVGVEFPDGFGYNAAYAGQNSTIATDRFDYNGRVISFRGFAHAASLYNVEFRVERAQTCDFLGYVETASFFGSGSMRVELTGPGGTVFVDSAYSLPTDDRRVTFHGQLTPGDYLLTINYQSQGLSTSVPVGSTAHASMTFESTGCDADFNGDQQADFFDYLDFAAAFDAEDPSADFNGDEQVDFFDYLDFVSAFDAGCE
jgi:hypothetical protein